MNLALLQVDWALLQCPQASELPALRWKLGNLQTFSQRRPADFEKEAGTLKALLAVCSRSRETTVASSLQPP